MSQSFIKNGQLAYAGAAVAAASNTDDDSSVFDMLGFSHAVFFTTITDSADTGVATLTVDTNTTNATGGTAVTGASAAATSAADDDLNGTLLIVEVADVLERYVYANRASATANIAFGEIHCFLHNGLNKARKVPLSAHSTVSTADLQVDA
jgi:hypothetical protein